MNQEYMYLFAIAKVLHVFGVLVVAIVSIALSIRLKKVGAYLMTIGALAVLILSIGDSLLITLISKANDIQNVMKFQGILGIITAFFFTIFGIGLVMLAMDLLKKEQSRIDQP